MARIPSSTNLPDIQQAFRELWETVRPLEAGPFDTRGRRVRGGDAIDPQEFVTKRQLEKSFIGMWHDNKLLMEAPQLPEPPVVVPPPDVPTELFRWNRADTTQFATLAVTGNPTQNTVLSVVTSQASSAIRTSPYLSLQHNVSTPPAQVGDSWLHTSAAFSGNNLMLAMDFAAVGTPEPTPRTGIIFSKTGSETTDYYLLALGAGGANQATLDKYIGGTRHAQGASSSVGSFGATNGASYKTIYWLIRGDGRSVIRMPGSTPDLIFDAPMTLGDSTVWASGKFGIKAHYDGSNSSFIGFSRMWIMSVPLEAEALFL